MTPNQLEWNLNSYEKQAVEFLSQKSKFFVSGFAFIFFFFVSFKFNRPLSELKISYLHYPNIAAAMDIIGYTCMIATINPLVKNRNTQAMISIFVFIVMWFLQVYFARGFQAGLGIYLSFPVLAAASVYIFHSQRESTTRALMLLLLFVLTLLICYLTSGSWAWLFRKKLHFFFFFVLAFIVTKAKLSRESFIALAFSPSHLALPVNFPLEKADVYEEKNYQVWISGLINLVKAYSCVLINMLAIHSSAMSPTNGILRSIQIYLSFLLTATAVGNFVTGMARVYYVNVVDCSNYLWLSSSPLDFFKRENTHAYLFSMRFFYFILLKYTRSIGLIVFIYFLFFPLYRNLLDFLTVPEFYRVEKFVEFFKITYMYWLVLFVAILITHRMRFFQIRTWGSVISTHFIMLLSFYIIFIF